MAEEGQDKFSTVNVPNVNQADVSWICRFHPTDWFHEVGCPHKEWTKEELQEALVSRKRFEQDRATFYTYYKLSTVVEPDHGIVWEGTEGHFRG